MGDQAVSVWVCMCMCVWYSVDNSFALHVCVGAGNRYMCCIGADEGVWTLAAVVRLHASRISLVYCCVLMHDPYGNTVSVCGQVF